MNRIAEYVDREIKRREISIRGFAELLGLHHNTVIRYLNGEEPTLDFLVKLAKATGADLIALIDLAYPGIIDQNRPSARAILYAQQLDQLPDEVREVIFKMIFK